MDGAEPVVMTVPADAEDRLADLNGDGRGTPRDWLNQQTRLGQMLCCTSVWLTRLIFEATSRT